MEKSNNTLLIFSSNVGSFGPANSAVLGNVFVTLNKIKDDFDKYPDVAGFGECGRYDVILAPFFGAPIGTDEGCEIMQNGANISRGVCTYADPSTTRVFKNQDKNFEVVTTIHRFTEFQNCTNTKKTSLSIISTVVLIFEGYVTF